MDKRGAEHGEKLKQSAARAVKTSAAEYRKQQNIDSL
jgi:hypothetical protein